MSGDLTRQCFGAALEACEKNEEILGRLDSIAGDGDHGRGMVRGFRAAYTATENESEEVGTSVSRAGDYFSDSAGGASGALWGVMLQTIGLSLEETGVSDQSVLRALAKGLDAVKATGKSDVGDKTFIDVLQPFIESLANFVEQGESFARSWMMAIPISRESLEKTAAMQSRRGRAAAVGERGFGSVDPGAKSLQLVLEAVGDVLAHSRTD